MLNMLFLILSRSLQSQASNNCIDTSPNET